MKDFIMGSSSSKPEGNNPETGSKGGGSKPK